MKLEGADCAAVVEALRDSAYKKDRAAQRMENLATLLCSQKFRARHEILKSEALAAWALYWKIVVKEKQSEGGTRWS